MHLDLVKHRQLEELQDKIAQRKQRQMSVQEKLQEKELQMLSSSETETQAESIGQTAAIILRQEQQRVQLLTSLEELASAEREEAARAADITINQAIAEKESSLLAKLDTVDDVAARAQLLKIHEAEMDALKKKVEIDRQRQLNDLEQRCKDRKRRKFDNTLVQLHAEELEKMESPETVKDAELIGLKVDVILKQELGTAQLHTAIAEQNAMEMRVLSGNLSANMESTVANAKAQLATQLLGKDDSERDRLMALHEIDMARIRAEAAVHQAKVQDDLHRSLQERKERKRVRLEQQHSTELEILSSAGSKESAARAIEHIILESSVEIEHEKKAAKMMYNVVSESQSEVKLLRNELSEKSAQIIQNEESRLAYEISHLDPNSSERQELLQVCLDFFIVQGAHTHQYTNSQPCNAD